MSGANDGVQGGGNSLCAGAERLTEDGEGLAKFQQ